MRNPTRFASRNELFVALSAVVVLALVSGCRGRPLTAPPPSGGPYIATAPPSVPSGGQMLPPVGPPSPGEIFVPGPTPPPPGAVVVPGPGAPVAGPIVEPPPPAPEGAVPVPSEATAEEGAAAPQPPAEEPPAEGAPAEPAPAVQPPVVPSGPEKSPEQLAAEERIRQAVEADQREFLVRQKLEMARDHIRRAEYADAERLLIEAQTLDPTNRDVRAELRDVQALLGRRTADVGGLLQEQQMLVKVRIEEQRATAQRFVNLGRTHMRNRRFAEAAEAFEQAIFIMTSSPYEIDWGTLRQDAENGLRDARRLMQESARREREGAISESLAEMAAAEEATLMAEMQRLEMILGMAIEAFYREDFELARTYAQQVLDVQADNTKALDLVSVIDRAAYESAERDFIVREKLAFREWMDEMGATRIPQQKILKWPSQSFWNRITTVRAKTRASFGEAAVDPEGDALRSKVAHTTVSISADNLPLRDVLNTLKIQTGINIHIDPKISDAAENQVTGLFLTDVPMDTVLSMLEKTVGEDGVWTTRGNMVIFTKREFVKKNLLVQLHMVADLVTGLTNFIPPTIQLVGPDSVSDEDNPLFGAESEDPILPYGSIDELIELIKAAVEPLFWTETEGADIKAQGNQLIVKATAPVQERVEQFLRDLRGFAGIVVTVETRFLEIGDLFLRDVGVDFRGLGDNPVGTLVNLDDVTNGLEDKASAGFDNALGIQQADALSPSAGAYYNDGADGDFRARTENIFDRSLGNILSALGGASFTLTYLDDTQLSAVVRAVEKTGRTRQLTAPKITVYNTQRANLTVVNQLSYIQDFDVEVAQTSFIADPIVGIIQDGLTLDVRPTVSNDRRYITLELQPTVADLVEPIQTFATTLGSSFSPVIIQLPELQLQQARTTVRIPDKGSILIGGLKNITTVDRASETPFLGKLPILSFFFSRKGRSDEMSHLMIIVRAEITDLAEQEEGVLGGRVPGLIAVPPSPFRLPEEPSVRAPLECR